MPLDVTELEAHRSALVGHCYRMLGSAFDADDAVQETMVRAWRKAGSFEGRSSVRTWLYRIATNVCLDVLSDRTGRTRPVLDVPLCTPDDDLVPRDRTHWVEPIPDARALPADANPHELVVLRQSIRLAFVAALQHLPPRQRAALILTEVLGWSAAEAAECLGMSVAAVNSALQRGRATLAARQISLPGAASLGDEALTDNESALLERYLEAFQQYDVDALVALLTEDATLSMPPFAFWLQGPADIRAWLTGRGIGCRGSKIGPVMASGVPAFAQWRPDPAGGFSAWGIIVLELEGGRIAAWNSYLDVEKLFPLFGLPLHTD
jgi:RNA polymerase sigma-70 factor (ECF subfamily)